MKQKIYPQGLDVDALTKKLEETFRAQGYDVQSFEKDGDKYVQIKKGGLRTIVGMSQALTVHMHRNGATTTISLGQARWVDKAAVEAIGFLVFLPLMIPGAVGIYEEHQLPGKIWRVIDDFASSQGMSHSEERIIEAVHCPNCGVTNSSEAKFCSACGAALK
jgi:hypothetical protein